MIEVGKEYKFKKFPEYTARVFHISDDGSNPKIQYKRVSYYVNHGDIATPWLGYCDIFGQDWLRSEFDLVIEAD